MGAQTAYRGGRRDPAVRSLFKRIRFYQNEVLQKELPPDKGQFEAQLDVTMKTARNIPCAPPARLNYGQIREKIPRVRGGGRFAGEHQKGGGLRRRDGKHA
jgi:hypothetical protein